MGGNTAIDLTSIALTSAVDAAYVERRWDVPPAKVLLEEKVHAAKPQPIGEPTKI